MSFCVCEQGIRKENHWALQVRSVIVFGRIEVIDDRARVVAITSALCHKFTQDEAYIQKEIEQHAHGTVLLRLVPEQICGKRVTEA